MIIFKTCYLRDERGLTLVEVLAVIVILGIVTSVAVLSFVGVREQVVVDVCHANGVELI